jgi:hypothetical protein
MSSKTFYLIFIAFAILAFAALIYHAIAIYHPETDPPVVSLVASLRHAIFILINVICIYGFLKRPKWFVRFFGVLTVQQLYSHGSHFINLLKENKFNLIDSAILVLMPLIFILLLMDRKTKQ